MLHQDGATDKEESFCRQIRHTYDLQYLQKADAHPETDAFSCLLAAPMHKRQTEVQLESCHWVRIHETQSSGRGGQSISQLCERALHVRVHLVARHGAVF